MASNSGVSRLCDIEVSPGIVQRACEGDECAQAHIYAALAPATFALIHHLMRNRPLAEDLFQDTLMSAYQSLDTFRGEAPLGAWVRRIAISKCLMYLRSPWHRARIRTTDFDADEVRAYGGALPVSSGPKVESLDLERALASLTPTARAVVWLFEVEGYSHEEIARSFGKSVSFSKSQLARAHSKLRDWFEPRVDRQTCTQI